VIGIEQEGILPTAPQQHIMGKQPTS
jgi:hypothetical protein